MSGDGCSSLFRGRLNRNDQVPPAWKKPQGFDYARQVPDTRDGGVFYKPQSKVPLSGFGGKEGGRRTGELVDLDSSGDIEHQDTVEGNDILQVLLGSSRQRAGRRRYTEPATGEDDQLPHGVAERDNVVSTRWDRGKLEEIIHEAARVADESISEPGSSSSLPSLAQWVGTLLVGISIVLTWPVVLAYLRG
ncbi:hypothetical protein PHYPSEUDO_004639 [Phytophthora pseudosyringae]|uniref:Uncharacterized protein n=1 Tax=Phytophthora pseudosyringae TaxID=221518 RepID=A0A8T1VR73_9STRA|nr:hypothetical protein PHYPSEUDO_004639 [Phytophthora pseudosyringae]